MNERDFKKYKRLRNHVIYQDGYSASMFNHLMNAVGSLSNQIDLVNDRMDLLANQVSKSNKK